MVKSKLLQFAILVILSWQAIAFADGVSIDRSNQNQLNYLRAATKTNFIFGTESVMLSSKTDSLMGISPYFGFEFSFSDQLSFASNINFAFQATGKPGAFFYSGLSGSLRYTYLGTSRNQSESVVVSSGRTIYSMDNAIKNRGTVFFGIEQLFLNGTTSIYPAVGFGIGTSYSFSMLSRAFEVSGRLSKLSANGNPLTMIAVGLSTNLSF